jgi:DNA-binding transcriptional ArsR family regulator
VALQQRLRLEIDASPAYEFILSLAAATSGTLPWPAPRELVREVRGWPAGCDMVWAHLLTVAYDTPPPRDPASFIKALGAMHPRELRLRLTGYYVRYFRRATPPEVMAAAVSGDRSAIRRFLATSYPDDELWQGALRVLLEGSAWDMRRSLVQLLREWTPVFAQCHRQAPLDAEVKIRQARARNRRPEQVVASVTDGWDYVPEPGIAAVLLIPSQVIWPSLHEFDHHSTKIVCYPVRSAAAAQATDPPAELLAFGQALADDRRLRILRTLAGGELPAQELALRLAMGLTTLLHHLAVLREAGLVSVRGERRKLYALRPEQIGALSAGLERFLRG